MTEIHMYDYRNEDRGQRGSYTNGKPDDEIKKESQINPLVPMNLTVSDSRTVYVNVDEWGDGTEFKIPEVHPDFNDQTIRDFFVESIRFMWSRSDSGPGTSTQWSIGRIGYSSGRISVSGTNRKVDGSRGLKTGSAHYPRFKDRVEDTGEIKDESYFGKPYDELPTFKQEWWGSPVTETFYDEQPLPQWLQAIVDRSHPVTGENPFTFGNDHVYGSFDA